MRRAIVCVLCLAACTATPKSDIAALEAALTAADTTALAYASLPKCAAGGAVLCADPAMAAKVALAAQDAYTAIKAAETSAADVSASSAAVTAALSAAETALGALQQILATLPQNGA